MTSATPACRFFQWTFSWWDVCHLSFELLSLFPQMLFFLFCRKDTICCLTTPLYNPPSDHFLWSVYYTTSARWCIYPIPFFPFNGLSRIVVVGMSLLLQQRGSWNQIVKGNQCSIIEESVKSWESFFRVEELPSNQSGIIGHKSQMFAKKQSTKPQCTANSIQLIPIACWAFKLIQKSLELLAN